MKKHVLLMAMVILSPTQSHAGRLADSLFGVGNKAVHPSTLSMDFTTGIRPPGFSYSNPSSNRSYYNLSGVLSFAASDIIRFNYNPETLTGPTMLYEPASQNYAYPSTLAAGWSGSGSVLSFSSHSSPSGLNDAATITESTATSAHYASNSGVSFPTFSSGQVYSCSIYLHAGTATAAQITLSSSAFGTAQYMNVDLSGGSIGTYGASTSNRYIQNVGGGWYRVGYTATATATASSTPFFIVLTNNNTSASRVPSYAGSSKNIYAYGAQIEPRSSITSLIPTTYAGGIGSRSTDSGNFWVPTGFTTVTYTFDDNSTQNESISGGTYHTIPTNLNRPSIKYISGS